MEEEIEIPKKTITDLVCAFSNNEINSIIEYKEIINKEPFINKSEEKTKEILKEKIKQIFDL